MPKVLFLYPNIQLMMIIPSSITSLSAYLKSKNIETDLFDTTLYKINEKCSDDARVEACQVKPTNLANMDIYKSTNMLEDFNEKVKTFQPDVLAVTVNDFTYGIANILLEDFKKNYPNIFVIMGGILPTFAPEFVLANQNVDAICRGEGYIPLYELVTRLHTKESITDIPNLWVNVLRAQFVNNICKPVDINELPYEDFTLFEEKRFLRPMNGKVLKMLPFSIDLGCCYNCTYCAAPTIRNLYKNQGYNYLRVKSIDRIIEELQYQIEKYKPNYLYALSETFLARSKQHIEEFAKQYKDKINLPFWTESRIETLTEENVQSLKFMGCDRLSIGLESGCEKYRRNFIKKTFTNDQFLNAIHILNKHKLNCTINNIINLPEESREMIFETIYLNRKAIEIGKDINISLVVSTFVPCMGSGLQQFCIEKEYFNLQEYLNNLPTTFHGGYYLKNPNIKKDELQGLYRTFPIYTRFPESFFKDIKKAEQMDAEGNEMFEKLRNIYWKDYFK